MQFKISTSINNLLKKIFSIQINKYYKPVHIFENLHFRLIKKSPVIFDVGANVGQSIEKYLDIFNSPKIHAFEPNEDAFKILFNKYSKYKNIKLNNFALGEKKGTKYLNHTMKSGNSSINKLNLNTNWIKEKSVYYKVKPKNYIIKKKKIELFTLDNYIKKNKIKFIDLVKMDTQGYEEKILMGAKNSLKRKIKNIEVEIMLDDNYKVDMSIYKIEKILNPKSFRVIGIYANKRDIFTANNFGINLFYRKN